MLFFCFHVCAKTAYYQLVVLKINHYIGSQFLNPKPLNNEKTFFDAGPGQPDGSCL